MQCINSRPCLPAPPADVAQVWDEARRAVLEEAVRDMLLPLMEREVRLG